MKKAIYLLLLLIFALNQSYAEKSKKEAYIDSLIHMLPQLKEDSQKVNLLCEVSTKLRRIDSKKSIDYGKKGLALAEKIGDKDKIASANYILGNTYLFILSIDSTALLYLKKALELETEKGDKEGMASVLNNIATSYLMVSNFPKALETLYRALRLFEQNGNKNGQANCLLNISNTFYAQFEFYKSIDYLKRALKLYKQLNSKEGIALALGNIGDIFAQLHKNDSAGIYFSESLRLYSELGDSTGIERNLANFGSLHLTKGEFDKALAYNLKAMQIAKLNQYDYELGHDFATAGEIYLAMGSQQPSAETPQKKRNSSDLLLTAKNYLDSAITVLSGIGDLASLSNVYESLSKTNHQLGNFKEAYDAHLIFKSLNDSIFNIEKDKKITQSAMQYEFDKKEAAVRAEQEKKDIRERNIRNSIAAGLAATLLFSIVVFRQRNKIKAGKKRSDELLLNILPEEIAEELKAKGSAEAQQIEEVTVLFTDFKGFTAMAEKLSAKELVNDIHECFSAFDRIIEKHGIEKIKTIGDAYMAAGGIPTANTTHAHDVVKAALEIGEFIKEGKAAKIAKGAPFFEIRIGVHTGPVVAGIVGVKKFAYDIWGDTVNLASRMESSGEVGKVNISGSTYALVKDKFSCIHRGKIAAKNKGEIDMYFVEESL